LNGRIGDVTRLTPQSNGKQLRRPGQPDEQHHGGRLVVQQLVRPRRPARRSHGVAPISLEAIEQIQVNVAPFDVRQGSFTGAGVNTVTRSGTNRVSGSFYHRFRDQDWVGTERRARPSTRHVQVPQHRGLGRRADPQEQVVRVRQLRRSDGHAAADDVPRESRGEAVGGQVTRVLASDLTALSTYLKTNFNTTPARSTTCPTRRRQAVPAAQRLQHQQRNKVSFRYNYLDSFSDTAMSSSTRRCAAANFSTSFLTFQNSNYQLLENIRSGIGEWNTVHRQQHGEPVPDRLHHADESRNTRGKISSRSSTSSKAARTTSRSAASRSRSRTA
jgi:hypothetical protein